MRVSQSAVSKLEHRALDDVSVAALRHYLAAWGDTLPPDWVDEIERVRRLTPEDRLREAAALSEFLAVARPKNV
jgi:hypothetical protein